MSHSIGANDARSALTTVEYGRQQVIAEIDLPRWYWLGLAAAWFGMGVANELMAAVRRRAARRPAS